MCLLPQVAPFPTENPVTQTNIQSAGTNRGQTESTGSEQVSQYLTAELTTDENAATDSMATEDGREGSTPKQSITKEEPRKWSTNSSATEDLPKQSKLSVAPRTSDANSGRIDVEDDECEVLVDRLVPSLTSTAEEAQLRFDDYVSILSCKTDSPAALK